MSWLQEYYQLKSSLKEFKRAKLLERVAGAKRQLLEEGWGCFGEEWVRMQDVPAQLDVFIQSCRAQDRIADAESGGAEEEGLPEYQYLRRLLGEDSAWEDPASISLNEDSDADGESQDSLRFEELVTPLF